MNPATGYPVTHNLLSATVIAFDGATADAYATWMMVIGEEKARELALQRDDRLRFISSMESRIR